MCLDLWPSLTCLLWTVALRKVVTGKQHTSKWVNLLLISACFSTLRNMLVLISQLADSFKSNRSKCLLIDNMRNQATIWGSNLCPTWNVALWDETKAAVEPNVCRWRVKVWQDHSSSVTTKENNHISLFPQPPVLYEMLLGTSMIQLYLEWAAMDHLPAA